MDFGSILTKAWQIIWNNKVLWIFGILASCGAGNQASGSFSSSGNSASPDAGTGDLPPALQEIFQNMQRNFNQIPEETVGLVLLGLFCLICIISIIAMFVSVYGRVGLITGTQSADAGASLSFSSVAQQISPLYWRALGLNFLLGLVVFILSLIFAVVTIGITIVTFGLGLLCLIPLFCLGLPLGVIYYVYTQLANNALIIEDLTIGDALARAWELMRSRAGDIAVMAIILFVGTLIAGVLISIPIFALFLPAFFAVMGNGAQAADNALTLGIVAICIAIPAGMLLGGILRSYIESAWTLTYLRVTQPAE